MRARFRLGISATICTAMSCLAAALPTHAQDLLKLDFDVMRVRDELLSGEQAAEGASAVVGRARGTPTIDGVLNEALWEAATLSKADEEGRRTRVAVTFDDDQLYVAFECEGPNAPATVATGRDGKTYQDDSVEWVLSVPGRAGEQFHFAVNAGGAYADRLGRDSSFDPTWRRAVRADGLRWAVEAAIPFAALGLEAPPAQLRANFGRISPGAESVAWSASYGEATGVLTLAGVTDVLRPAAAVQTEEMSATAGSALTLLEFNPRIGAGERWARVRAAVDLVRFPDATVTAQLYGIGDPTPISTSEAKATHSAFIAWADLRSTALTHARLVLTVRRGGDVVGAAEVMLSGEPPAGVMTPGQRVEMKIDVPAGLRLAGPTPVTFGFPVAEGALWSVGDLRVVDRSGAALAFQAEVSGRWNKDGAIKWVRFDAVVDPAQGCFVEFAPATSVALPSGPRVSVTRQGDAVILETGAATYVVGAGASPIHEIRDGDRTVATSRGARGLYVVDQAGREGVATAVDTTVEVEAQGPVAASVRIEGPYVDSGGHVMARHITRIEAFAGERHAKVTHTLVLVNDTNQVWFREIGWALKASVGNGPAAVFNRSRAEASAVVEHSVSGSPAYMVQESHVRYQAGVDRFVIASDEAGQSKPIAEGKECGDWAALRGSQAALMVGCREAARQHPKEFFIASDRVDLKLFSARAGEELDFRTESRMKIWNISEWLNDGVPAKNRAGAEDRIRAITSNAVGWSKTHELVFAPLEPTTAAADAAILSRLNSEGVFVHADPSWVYETRVLGPLYPRDPERFGAVEAVIDAVYAWWDKRGEVAGEWGFVDAFAGPHMAIRGKREFPMMRRFPLAYTLRRDLWLLYARSGDRNFRRMAHDTVRTYMDGCMARWDGNGKVRGLYVSGGSGSWMNTASAESVPLYWEPKTNYQTGTTADLNDFLLHYQITGYRRAKEAVLDYAEALRRTWTPTTNRRDFRQLRLLHTLVQAYVFTGDEAIRVMAEDMVGVLWEPEGELHIDRDKPYGSPYKVQSDFTVIAEAARVLRDPRLVAMADASATAMSDQFIADHPVQYSFPMGAVSTYLYERTRDPRLATAAVLSLGQALATFNAEQVTFRGRKTMAPESQGIVEGFTHFMHLIAMTNADRTPAAGWAAVDVGDEPVSVLIKKGGQERVELQLASRAAKAVLGDAGAGLKLRAWGVDKPGPANQWTLGLSRIVESSGVMRRVVVPLDAPAGMYEVSQLPQGPVTVLGDGRSPLVIEAPQGFRVPFALTPAKPIFFNVPSGSDNGRLFVEAPAVVVGPDGQSVNGGTAVQGWFALPAGAHGLWSVLPAAPGKIQVENVPSVFAFGDPAFYFEPYPRTPPGGAADE